LLTATLALAAKGYAHNDGYLFADSHPRSHQESIVIPETAQRLSGIQSE